MLNLWLTATAAAGQDMTVREFAPARLANPPVIDGALDDEAWAGPQVQAYSRLPASTHNLTSYRRVPRT